MTATLAPPTGTGASSAPPPIRSRSRRELGGLAVLLVGTAVLYLWNLGANGYANSFYAASVQAGTKSWKALLFASLDAGNVVTVDKPPASMWVMALSGRIFGFSSWSMLVPEALMGVASVALVYAAVRRISGPTAGLLAGAVLALTPVAVVMFRFNNPDALLVLLMVAAAYAVVRATEVASTRWLVLAGVLIGFGFLTKMMQAFLVLPAFVLVYLVCAPTGFWRRVRQLLMSAVALVVSAGWFVALVELWPADSRPYIGGSQGNSLLELALGYNGLSRIFGGEGGPGGGGGRAPGGTAGLETLPPAAGGGAAPELVQFGGPGGGGGGFGGTPGPTRMFSETSGGQISWLLPAALALLVLGLWLVRRAPRTDRVRASLLLWGGWTVVTMLVFSFAQGIFHEYYTVALAPGIAGLVGVGGRELWRHRETVLGRVGLAVIVAGTAAWAWVLLGRTPEFLPWLRWVVLALAAVAVVAALVPRAGRRGAARIGAVGALVAVLAGIAAPAAYAAQSAGTAHTGSTPTAGPQTAGGGFGGGRGGRGAGRVQDGTAPNGATPDGATPDGTAPGGTAPNGTGPQGDAAGGAQPGGFGGFGGGGPGGEDATADPALIAALQAAGTKWSAAAIGSMAGGPLALQSDTTVMSIGGFSGSDPAPTLEQFQAYVAAGEVHYFIPGNGPGGGGGGAAANGAQEPGSAAGRAGGGGFGRGGTGEQITTWVAQNFASTSIGGRTVYDLTQPVG